MRHTLLCAIMALVPTGLTTDTESVSLSKFVPRIENLPQTCQVAYNAGIEGCTRADFPKNRDESINNCSAECVNGLIKIVALVNQQCSTVKVPADSIIGVSLSGNLLPKLCGNIVVKTESESSTQTSLRTSSTSTEASTTQQAQSSSTQATGNTQSTPSTEAASSVTPNQSIQIAPSSTSQGLTFDTSTPPPAPSQTSSEQSSPGLGGGTPFDITFSDMSSPSRMRIGSCALIAIFGVIASFVFFL